MVDSVNRRQFVLKRILSRQPGNSAEVQRTRLLAAMNELGSVTTLESMRYLDVFDPRPRIHELRRLGFLINTHPRVERTECGFFHRVGAYVFHGNVSVEMQNPVGHAASEWIQLPLISPS